MSTRTALDCERLEPDQTPHAMSKTPGQKSPSGTQAIDRALLVLSSFVDFPEQGLIELAERTELSPSTVHRIVRALVNAGYLDQAPVTDRYRFGPAAVVLGQSARESLGFDLAIPLLQQLGGETGESINMGVLDGHEVIVVLRVESVQPLRFDQPTGSRIAVHGSSMGKSLLAFSPNDLPEKLPLHAITSSTINTRAALEAELAAVRQHGFAYDHEESIPGVSCVGAPVLDANGHAIAAVAVQGPTVRMTQERLLHLGRRVVETTEAISRVMNLDPNA